MLVTQLLWAADQPVSPTSGISVVTYDPETMQLQIMFQDGTLVSHLQVPQEVYDEFNHFKLDPAFYQEKIVAVYPPVNPDPLHEKELGPVDEAYVNSLKEIPLAVLQLCNRAVHNAILGGNAALRECQRLKQRSVDEDYDDGQNIAGQAENIVMQTLSAARQAELRMERKEYKQAHELVEKSALDLQRLVDVFAPATKNASSVSIREHHQASHFITNYSMLMEHANKALNMLRKEVESREDAEKKQSGSETAPVP